jgi:hypothetical protein
VCKNRVEGQGELLKEGNLMKSTTRVLCPQDVV